MTCKDCAKWDTCEDESKSGKVKRKGNSYASYCDEFLAREGRSEAHKDGYTAIQSGRCGYDFAIFNDATGKMVLHCICREHKTAKDLAEMIDFYIQLKRGERADESDTET